MFCILDGLLIANEYNDCIGRAWSTLKLDTDKSFHVNWKFLLPMMKKMGFRKK